MSKRLVFLDLEGTLIDVSQVIESPIPKSMWQSLARMLGPDCLREEELSHQRWLEGKTLNYVAWMDETVRMFVRYGLRKQHIDELNSLVQATPGISQFAERIHSAGGIIAIVTGALKSVAEPIFIATKAEHLFAGCELFFDSAGKVVHWNLLPSDWYGKVDFMELLIREYGAESRDCVFVGDGSNDVELAKRVGFSIGFNPDPALEGVVSLAIKQSTEELDFSELVADVERFWSRNR